MLYPIAWACSEGGNVISPNKEMIWYGVLHFLPGHLFLYYFLFGLRNTSGYDAFGFHSGKYSDSPYGGTGGPGGGAGANTGTGVGGLDVGPNMTGTDPGVGTCWEWGSWYWSCCRLNSLDIDIY